MADIKFTALTELLTRDTQDIVCIVDDPGGTPLSRKMTLENVLALGYASIYTSGGAVATATLAPGVWTKLTQFTVNGAASLLTPDHTLDAIALKVTGVYRGEFSCSFKTDGIALVEFAIHLNSLATHIVSGESVESGEVGSVAASGHVAATGGDPMDLYVRADGAVTVTPIDMHLIAERRD